VTERWKVPREGRCKVPETW